MEYIGAVFGCFSIFNFPNLTLSKYSFATSSKIGDNILHGLHHSAQKSTNTNFFEDSTSS